MSDSPSIRRETNLLSDQPSSVDAFEGGHERVAQGLSELVEDEDGGKAVALSGPYGSGKSTVVRLLEDKMKGGPQDTRVFVYDAWEHQGDPLRRSFIDSIIEFLRDEEWAGEKEWEDEQERLARRKETTTVETKPKLKVWGRWVALALFLSPLGIVFVNSFVKTKDGTLQGAIPEVLFWIGGLFVALLPILLIGAAWIFSGRDPFYVLVKKSEQEEETKTIRTPDPTTIEFQHIFQKIVKKTISGSSRQLIVVVDNLDRLPPEQALQTWATMRTFFENGTRTGEWEKKFWLLVPINFEALEGLFGKEEKETSSDEEKKATSDDEEKRATSDNETPSDSANSDEGRGMSSNDHDTVQAFADKTFHTVFHVSPPVLSDWEKFMKDQLRKAFPEKMENGETVSRDYHAVYRVYRTAGVRKNQIPTPHDIKVFINRLSALYRQWGDEMDLKTLAAFELKRNLISPNGHEITEGTLLSDRLKGELEPSEWQKSLQPSTLTSIPNGPFRS